MTNPYNLFSHFVVNSDNQDLYTLTDGIVRPDRVIDMTDAMRLGENAPFWAVRAKAIQAYASLEQGLCHVFASCGEMSRDVAGTIFFKISSADARSKILEKLIRRKHGSEFNLFWSSYLKCLRQLNGTRNQIVHWGVSLTAKLDAANVLHAGVSLIPPAYWGKPEVGERMLTSDFEDFAVQCDVFARLANIFAFVISSGTAVDAGLRDTWLEIYRQPLVYPLPAAHPLHTIPQTPDIQHPTSQA